MRPLPLIALTAFLLGSGLCSLAADPAPPSVAPYVPKQSDRPEAIEGDEAGFQSIFDGHSLAGWEGNPVYWRVEEGSIIGEITPSTVVKSNTFIIWRGGRPRDFELKLEYRITPAGNSGINYRSARVADTVTPDNPFAMRGDQFDIDGKNRYTGNNYEEKGLFLAVRGQISHVVGGRPPILLSTLGTPTDLESAQTPGWNSVHLIVRGNLLLHSLNGRLMSVVIDDDAPHRPLDGELRRHGPHRPLDGEIGMQVHVGPPMKVEYRNLRLKNLSDGPQKEGTVSETL